MVISNFRYYCEIHRYIKQPISRLGIELTFARFFHQMRIYGDEGFKSVLKNWVFELLETRPGVELISRISSFSHQHFIVAESNEIITHYNHEYRTIVMDRDETDAMGIKYGKIIPFKMPAKIRFAHELIHFLHVLENEEKAFQDFQSSVDLIDPEFHNREEQLTITGLDRFRNPNLSLFRMTAQNDTYYLVDGCNENSFLAAFKFPLRYNHVID